MNKKLLTVLVVLSMAGLLGAASLPDAEEMVRRGNAAFARGEYEEAEEYYRQAEESSTDPGLVAFNKAAALYRNGDYKEAEKHYWLCLGDAGVAVETALRQRPSQNLPATLRASAGPRLAQVLYNLANCVVQRSQGTDGDALGWALVLYDHCLRALPTSHGLRPDIRHNLKLARDLARLHPRKAPKRDPANDENPENKDASKANEKSGREQGNVGANNEGTDGKEPDGSQDSTQGKDDGNMNKGERSAGKGKLAALPDTDELASLSGEEASAFLQSAVQRIKTEERRDYESQTPEKQSGKVLDW